MEFDNTEEKGSNPSISDIEVVDIETIPKLEDLSPLSDSDTEIVYNSLECKETITSPKSSYFTTEYKKHKGELLTLPIERKNKIPKGSTSVSESIDAESRSFDFSKEPKREV